MSHINIVADQAAARRALESLGEKTFKRSVSTAVNDTARQTKTHAVRLVMKAAGLKSKTVNSAFVIRRSTPDTLSARVVASGRPFRLIDFKARQTKRGVTASAWGQRKLYKGSFVATLKSGLRGVFVRRGKKRFPIRQLYGPGVPDTLGQEAVMAGVIAYSGERLQTNILRQIDRAQRRAAGF